MPSEAAERRLAAIMFTDIVGYTALMGESEEAGLLIRQRHREVVRPLVERYHGEWIEETGDESLSTFQSAVDAVNCALAVQEELRDDAQLRVRIGIHVGDVVFEGGNLYGDGVNVASRIRPLAEPGGICVSDEVQHSIKNQSNVQARLLGERELKNVDRPVPVFAISGAAEAPRPFARARPRVGVWAAVALAVVVAGWLFWVVNQPVERTFPGFSGRPAIAVLPLDNLSSDPEQSVFADGLAEDLTTRLASWRSFPVIARGSSFSPDLPNDAQQAGRELGARYVVDGSVREAGERIRIVVQLIDASTGRQVWADQYDRALGDVLALQDEISQAIVGAMNPALLHSEIERAMHQDPESLDAWGSAMRGWWHFNQANAEDMAQARMHFERAIELDPQWGYAWAGVALTHFHQLVFGWSDSPETSARLLAEAAQTSVALDELGAQSHHALGHAFAVAGQPDRMIGAFEQGVELNPSDHMANNCFGHHLAFVGRSEEAIEALTRAMSLSPRDPLAFAPRLGMARAYFVAEDYERALEWAEKAIQRRPNLVPAYRIAAASAAHLGRLDQARRTMEEAERLQPLSRELFESVAGIMTPDFRDRLAEGMRKAGWDA